MEGHGPATHHPPTAAQKRRPISTSDASPGPGAGTHNHASRPQQNRQDVGKKYALAGALLGVARDPEKLAETAFLQYPTQQSPNHYHIYQGTQQSRPITQDNIPSWWALLALVLREEGTDGGPNQNLAKMPKQHKPQQAKRGTQLAKTSKTKSVKKTINKRQSTARSQHSNAAQRKQALQAIIQATAN